MEVSRASSIAPSVTARTSRSGHLFNSRVQMVLRFSRLQSISAPMSALPIEPVRCARS